jgi:glycosyltransferase involved in cell wall biosynthesis
VPVVGFDVGGIPDIVRNGETGVLVEAGNAQALATAIEALLADDERRGTMAVNCRRVAVEEYGLESQAQRYAELYRALLGQQAEGRAAHGSNGALNAVRS